MKTERALITGASSGLGRALAVEMAEEGYEVILVSRSQERLVQAMAQASAEARKRMRTLTVDLSETGQVSMVAARGQSLFQDSKPINILVNCAGYAVSGRVEEIPLADFERCWKVNFSSAVCLIQQVIPSMRAAGHGVIVNVGSGVARRALPYVSPYCAAKSALLSFTDSLRVELANDPISVLMFSPGPVESSFHNATVHRGQSALQFPPFHGKDPAPIAHQLLKAIKHRKERVVLGGKASIAHHLNYWSPRLTDWVVKRMYRVSKDTMSESQSVRRLHR